MIGCHHKCQESCFFYSNILYQGLLPTNTSTVQQYSIKYTSLPPHLCLLSVVYFAKLADFRFPCTLLYGHKSTGSGNFICHDSCLLYHQHFVVARQSMSVNNNITQQCSVVHMIPLYSPLYYGHKSTGSCNFICPHSCLLYHQHFVVA